MNKEEENQEELEAQNIPAESEDESVKQERKSFKELYLPSKEFIITPIIILLNVLVFLLMVLDGVDPMLPSIEDLLRYGGNFRSNTFGQQEYWRLLSSNYLHIGAFHLLFNMYALLIVGRDLERTVGRIQLILLYTFTGIVASITSITFNDFVVSAGASGAIFGAYGYYLILLLTKQVSVETEERNRLLSSISIFIGYNLFFGFTKANIDNSAHIGGLLSGAIFCGLFYLAQNQEFIKKLIWPILSLVIVFSVWYIPSQLSTGASDFQADAQTFTKDEEYGISFLNNYYALRDRPKGRELLDSNLVLWKKNELLFEKHSKRTELPEIVRLTSTYLAEYSALRNKECLLIDSLYKFQLSDSLFFVKFENTEKEVMVILDKLNKMDAR